MMQGVKFKRKRIPHKKLLLVGLVVILAACGAAFYYTNSVSAPAKAGNTGAVSADNGTDASPDIKLLATGDWIAHDSLNSAALQPNGSYNYLPMVADFEPIFKRTDIRFCNDPILNGGKSLGITGYPKFNSPTAFVTDMGQLGCNLANLASNHSFDFSQQNITNSVTAWQHVPHMLAFAGENQNQAQHDAVRYFSVKGIKFAFLAYTTYTNTDAPPQNSYGVNLFSDSFAASQISTARHNGAKFIIVSMRWGTEYDAGVTAEQVQDAQFLADQGVNLVLGHGTHVLQPVAWLNGAKGSRTLVWYGLGDFLQTQIPADTVFNGIAGMDINSKTLQIDGLQFLPIFMHYDWSTAQATAQDLSARTNLHLYLLQDVSQSMIDAQQLNTSVSAQRQRLQTTLDQDGVSVPLVDSGQFLTSN